MKWSYILFLPTVVSFIWALATVLLKKQLTRAQLLQSLTLILEGAAMLLLAIFFRGRAGSLFIYDFLFETLAMFCPTMYYISICSLTEPRGVTLRQRRIFIAPLFYILGLTIGAFWLGPRRYEVMCHALREGGTGFLRGDLAWNFMYFWEHYFFAIYALLIILVVVIVCSVKTHRYQLRFNSYYADNLNTPKISTRALHIFSWCFAVLAIVAIFAADYRPFYYKYWLIVLSVLLAVFQYLSGHFCYRMDYDARYLADLIRNETTKPSTQQHIEQ